jgi:Na+-transporting NADH:ubiquinone oxidoreductase subunit C
MQRSVAYIFLFATAVCVVCGVLVSSSAVTLQDRQAENALLEKRTNVLQAAGLVQAGEPVSAQQVEELFEAIRPVVLDLDTGEPAEGVDPESFDQQEAKKDPATSHDAPENRAGIKRVPDRALVYEVLDESGGLEMIVLPIEGVGLWSTLYGFVALESDTTTVRGLTYYQHGETPGLGGEVDNPSWKARWPGRKVYDDQWQPTIEVVKGAAGPPAQDPHEVDGLSGASITSRAVTNMLHFWLGENGFGPYLERLRDQEGRA